MNGVSRVNLHWTVVVASAVALLAIGAGTAYITLRSGEPASARVGDGAGGSAPSSSGPAGATSAPTSTATTNGKGALPDVIVTLSPDAVERAGITVTPVTTGTASAGIRLPGLVEPNAYKQVAVTPLIAGRITRVLVALGDQVRQGQTLAEVFSPELADTQTRYISARADLDAHERELKRTEALVEIGAASRQELERIHAEHTARTADVQSVRSRLELLGMPASAIEGLAPGAGINASTIVPAPISGVVTERLANVGLNVDPTATLFTVVDLSTVWVVADLYERDFSRVRVGSPATVTTTAYPDAALQGRVSYIDPQVSPQTRTAKVRVEVANARHDLRLGMYADVLVGNPGEDSVLLISRTAVQNVGDRQVVYLVDPKQAGTFTERDVRLGQASGEQVAVLSGVRVGDVVVVQGSFSIRAERERLGLRQSATQAASAEGLGESARTQERQTPANVQAAKIIVGEQGYEPARIALRAGIPARLTFVRTTDKTCGTELVFPSLNIRRALPLNQPVNIEFTPDKAGDIAFACGMDMLHGTIVVE